MIAFKFIYFKLEMTLNKVLHVLMVAPGYLLPFDPLIKQVLKEVAHQTERCSLKLKILALLSKLLL